LGGQKWIGAWAKYNVTYTIRVLGYAEHRAVEDAYILRPLAPYFNYAKIIGEGVNQDSLQVSKYASK